jgi:Flp pilus assembly protein TadG
MECELMKNLFQKIRNLQYWKEEKGSALMETAILFPAFTMMLIAVFDLGQGVNVNQKTVASAQIVADLIARNKDMSFAELQDIIRAGRMALEPYDTSDYGYDIVSVRFDEDSNPNILWRVTENMNPNDVAIDNAGILELTNEGLVIVTTNYTYQPLFTDFVVDEIDMNEVAFLRGRKNSTIYCDDCPGG